MLNLRIFMNIIKAESNKKSEVENKTNWESQLRFGSRVYINIYFFLIEPTPETLGLIDLGFP